MNETGEFSTLLHLEGPAEGATAAFLLTVVSGPEPGATLLVDPSLPSRAYVGTSSSCELRLRDGRIARRHLALEVAGERLRTVDLGSSSGTTVDGVMLVEGLLRGGEVLALGDTTIQVERRDALPGAKKSRAERFGRVIGASPEMQRLYPLCERLASTTVPVVIEGEPGTGKEAIAEALHEQGPRAQGPFVVLDCSAISPSLVIAEMFERARGGTLLVDEIGELEPAMQARLLDVLRRSADDVRALFTTRRDLDRLVHEGRLDEELFERISVARLELPPLRRRTGDVRRLSLHFAREMGGPAATLPPDLVALWENDPWPGNVRALRDAVARWLALDEDNLGRSDSFEDLLAEGLPFVQARDRLIAELERRYVERLLGEHDGDAARAAEASGIARRHFGEKT